MESLDIPGKRTYKSINDGDQKQAKTIEEIVDDVGFGWPQAKIIIFSSVVYIADSMEIMVLSILSPTLEYEWHISRLQQALLTTVVFLGCLFGCLFFGYMADQYGRRKSLIFCAIWTIVYGILSALAPNFTWMMILRMILGFGLGGEMLVQTYCIEFLPGRYRWNVGMLPNMSWAMGGITTVLLAMLLMKISWRWWLLASAVPSLLFLVFTQNMPASPRYELACGRKKEALTILSDLAKQNGHDLSAVEIKPIQVNARGNFADLLKPELRKTSILLAIAWFNTGFLYYGIVIFSTFLIKNGESCSKGIGVVSENQCHLEIHPLTTGNYLELLWTSSADLFGAIMVVSLVEILGRKLSSSIQQLVNGLMLLSLNICMPKIPILVLLFLLRGFAESTLLITYLYTNEVYPTEVRSISMGTGSAIARVGGMITPYFAQVLFSYSMHTGLTVYAVASIFNSLVYYLLPVETKGKDMFENADEGSQRNTPK